MAGLSMKSRSALHAAVTALAAQLGENLHSCILYGSAVRGDFVQVVSDVNLLIVLNESTPAAHATIARAVKGKLRIDPFVIGRPGMERSFNAFALKFLSIQRNYEVLHGADVLAGLDVDPDHERFLCEQALRNVRLRLVRGYIVFGTDRERYTRFLVRWIPTIFIDLSEALRLIGTDIPHDFIDRIPILARGFNTDVTVLEKLLELKEHPPHLSLGADLSLGRRLSAEDIERFHDQVFRLLTHAIDWMAERWPQTAAVRG